MALYYATSAMQQRFSARILTVSGFCPPMEQQYSLLQELLLLNQSATLLLKDTLLVQELAFGIGNRVI